LGRKKRGGTRGCGKREKKNAIILMNDLEN
jgi:hypothetical protein